MNVRAASSGALHGTNLGNWGGGSDPMGYRFMNGASWAQHNFEDIAAGETVEVSFFKGEFSARVESVDRKKLLESRFLKEGS